MSYLHKQVIEIVVVVVALLFYVHGKHLRSCQVQPANMFVEKPEHPCSLTNDIGLRSMSCCCCCVVVLRPR